MLFMAPEGTCGDGRCILQFRRGAFVPGVPVLPVLLKYDKSCHNPAWTLVNVPFSFVCPDRRLAHVPVSSRLPGVPLGHAEISAPARCSCWEDYRALVAFIPCPLPIPQS